LNVFHFSAECVPFAKVGGLADVVGSLPAVLNRMGHDARVVMPHHGTIDNEKHGIKRLDTFDMQWNGETVQVEIAYTNHDGVPVYLIRGFPFFQRNESFVYSHDEGIDVGRFLFFSMAGLQLVRRLAGAEEIEVDAIHAHDWHTGMVPFLLRRVLQHDPVLRGVPTVFSIHNMQYQGYSIEWHLDRSGLRHVDHPLLRAMGVYDNCLAVGLAYSTMLSTVSPHYADEIVNEGGGYGLSDFLHTRQKNFRGILNGIDTHRWNPATSKSLAKNYDVDSIGDRAENKAALQKRLGLPQRPDVPMLGVISRLSDQKGIDIMLPALGDLLNSEDVQLVVLGTGPYHYETGFRQMGDYFPEKASINLSFHEGLAEQIYAGIDIFVMPSLFEPCGLGQMLAMRYGAIPVVRAVGGLVDTVDPETGFLFRDYHPGALSYALSRAISLYRQNKKVWAARMKRAMKKDFSWERSAGEYIELYQSAKELHLSYLQQ